MNELERLRSRAKAIKAQYPAGTRIMLISMDDSLDPVPSGTKGTVVTVDAIGQILMKWDNGRTLSLNTEVDRFRVITDGEGADKQRLTE